jgi:hypothetical protein
VAAGEDQGYGGARRSLPRQATLTGEQDALGSWTRHGRRLARALGRALARHPGAVRGGSVLVEARGGSYTCTLNAEFLQALVGPTAQPAASASAAAALEATRNDRHDANASATAPVANHPDGLGRSAEPFWDPRPELALLRRRGEVDGWALRNWPAALAYPEGVLFPDFALTAGAASVYVMAVDTPALAATAARLAPRLAARGDVLLAATAPFYLALRPLRLPLAELPTAVTLASSPVPSEPRADGGVRLPPGPLAAVLAVARAMAPRVAPPAATSLDQVLAAVREVGFLPTERALALAACGDEAELAGRLAAAGVEDVRLVTGVGLHTEVFLRRLHGVPAANGAA